MRGLLVTARSGRIAEFPSFETLPDIVRKGRRLMEEIGAADFAFILLPGGLPPEPLADSDYPGNSGLSARLAGKLSEQLQLLPNRSPMPFWWAKRDISSHAVLMLQRLRWARRVDAPEGLALGLGFPLMADGQSDGLVLFEGEDLILNDRIVCEVHARCLALFSVLARLHIPATGRQPQLSRREVECLKLTASGLTSHEIADRLGLSANTANQYLMSSGQKLNAVNRTHAVAKALRGRLIE